jgi:hypothetical protein
VGNAGREWEKKSRIRNDEEGSEDGVRWRGRWLVGEIVKWRG